MTSTQPILRLTISPGARPVPTVPAPSPDDTQDANEKRLGKALPDTVIRQLDQHLSLLGPTGRHGSMSAADLQAMQPDHLPDPA
jgi:hypothetical protein